MKELVCIVCPKGCRLKVDEANDYKVTGNGCPRGAEYGKTELLNPTRVITSTVKAQGGLYNRCPVKTNIAIKKGMIMDVMDALNAVTLKAPVHIGDVVIQNVCNTGADIVATKNL